MLGLDDGVFGEGMDMSRGVSDQASGEPVVVHVGIQEEREGA